MTMIETRQPDFPENPSDGFQIREELPDGSGYVIWTYNAFYNEWTNEVFKTALDGYITTRQVMTVGQSVLPGTTKEESHLLQTQEAVNNFIAEVSERGLKATFRTADQVDFLQNSVGKGVWSRVDGLLGPDEYPGPAQFWADNTEFKKINQFKFNDTGVPGATNPGSLEDTRVGDYLTVQCNDRNEFGQYVIHGMTTENIVGEIIRTFDVKLYRNARAVGELSPLATCTVTTFRPSAVIVQDEQPVVSSRGILWYREKDDHLFISNYADGFTGEGPQWTDLTASGGGEVSGDYLPLTGGTVDGLTTITHTNAISDSSYVFNVKGSKMPEGNQVAFRVTASGAVKAGHDSSRAFMAEAANDVTTKKFTDDTYLSLDGGKVTGDLSVGGSLKTLNVDSGQGSNLNLRCNGATKIYVGQSDTTVQGPLKLNTEGTQDSHVVSKAYVDSSSSKSIRRYKFSSDREMMSLRPGEFILLDKAGDNNISEPENAFAIAFHGENYEGTRSVADGDAITYESFMGAHLSILNGDLSKTYMRVHGYGGLPSYGQINYFKDQDIYIFSWPDNAASPKVSSFTRFTNGQVINLRIPDLFL